MGRARSEITGPKTDETATGEETVLGGLLRIALEDEVRKRRSEGFNAYFADHHASTTAEAISNILQRSLMGVQSSISQVRCERNLGGIELILAIAEHGQISPAVLGGDVCTAQEWQRLSSSSRENLERALRSSARHAQRDSRGQEAPPAREDSIEKPTRNTHRGAEHTSEDPQQYNAIEACHAEIKKEVRRVIGEHQRQQEEIDTLKNELREIKFALRNANAQIANLQGTIDEQRQRIAELTGQRRREREPAEGEPQPVKAAAQAKAPQSAAPSRAPASESFEKRAKLQRIRELERLIAEKEKQKRTS